MRWIDANISSSRTSPTCGGYVEVGPHPKDQRPFREALGLRQVSRSALRMQLVLIGGAQRSGTTLLQTLLANALGSSLLPESHVLCDILMAYKRAKGQWRKTHFFYPTEDDLLDFFRSFASRHVEDLARSAASQSVLVLKDPNFVQVLAEASAIFPTASASYASAIRVTSPHPSCRSARGSRKRKEAQPLHEKRHSLHRQKGPFLLRASDGGTRSPKSDPDALRGDRYRPKGRASDAVPRYRARALL